MNVKKQTNKFDLFKFQKNLNRQFSEIATQKQLGLVDDDSGKLGLEATVENISMLIMLKDLHSISSKNTYEHSIKSKSWLMGFNHDFGNIFTILNFKKCLKFLMEGKSEFNVGFDKKDCNIIYFKSSKEDYFGISVDSMKLNYVSELTNVISIKENKYSINKDFLGEIKDKKIEDKLLNKILSNAEKDVDVNLIYKLDLINENNEDYLLLSLIIENVFLNKDNKLLFELNIDKFLWCFKNISPF